MMPCSWYILHSDVNRLCTTFDDLSFRIKSPPLANNFRFCCTGDPEHFHSSSDKSVDKLNFLKAHFMPFTHMGSGGCCEGLEIA